MSQLINLTVIVFVLICSLRGEDNCTIHTEIANCHRLRLDHLPGYIPNTITTLNMSANVIKGISHQNFSRFTNVKMIDLSNNYIQADNIDQYTFTGLQLLNTVNLVNNHITSLKSGFLNTSRIKQLILDKNPITQIQPDFLILFGYLTHLSLRDCKLRSISPQAFNLLGSKLEYLDLSENSLQTLDSQLRPYIFTTDLKELRIYENPWNCDCRLKWLRQEIENGTQFNWRFRGNALIPRCERPDNLWHEVWFSKAPVEKFGCPPKLIKIPKIYYTEQDVDLRLTVSVETSTNPDSVIWIQNGYKLYWRERLHVVKSWNETVYSTTLTISGFTESDYGLYSCTVNTTFGSVRQEITVRDAKEEEQLTASIGVIVAIVIVSILVILITVLLVLFCMKKRCGYSGKWDMNRGSKSSSAVSRSDCYVSAEDVADDTPLSPTQPDPNRPDIIKVYPEEELIALPADDEYPEDDAGCKEYNEFLELTKPNPRIHSPNTSSSSSQSPPGLVGPPPFQPSLVPYTPSMKSFDGTSQQTLPTTSPSGSPLTYIKEEVEEDVL